MNKIEVDKLIFKLINNSITDQESEVLVHWLEKSENLKYFNEFIEINHLINSKRKFDHRYSLTEFIEKQTKPASTKTKNNYWKYTAIAASIVLLISINFILNKKDGHVIEPVIVHSNIKIGTDKATLTLEDGSDVVLEKGKKYSSNTLESNGEEIIYKPSKSVKEEITYNYLTIPRGGQYHVKLSDGTQVWLNSESKIKYPVNFIEGKTRIVELVYGEAYFDVAPSAQNKGTDFKVYNQFQEIRVLGTEFNIKAYKDETNVYTTLVEGKVAIDYNGNKQNLIPNQQSSLNINTKELTLAIVDVHNETSWKDGIFSFKGKPLKDITKVLSRWYDVEVVITDKTLDDIMFKGVLGKNQNIEDVLYIMKNTSAISAYEITEKAILIK